MKLSDETRKNCIEMHDEGKNKSFIAKSLRISRQQVQHIVKRFKNEGIYEKQQ